MTSQRLVLFVDDFACAGALAAPGLSAIDRSDVTLFSSTVAFTPAGTVCFRCGEEPPDEEKRSVAALGSGATRWTLNDILASGRLEDTARYFVALIDALAREMVVDLSATELVVALPLCIDAREFEDPARRAAADRAQTNAVAVLEQALGLAALSVGIEQFALVDAHAAAADQVLNHTNVRSPGRFAVCIPWRRHLSFLCFHTQGPEQWKPVLAQPGFGPFATRIDVPTEAVVDGAFQALGMESPGVSRLIATLGGRGGSSIATPRADGSCIRLTARCGPGVAELSRAVTHAFDEAFRAGVRPPAGARLAALQDYLTWCVSPGVSRGVDDFHLAGAAALVEGVAQGIAGKGSETPPAGLACWFHPRDETKPRLLEVAREQGERVDPLLTTLRRTLDATISLRRSSDVMSVQSLQIEEPGRRGSNPAEDRRIEAPAVSTREARGAMIIPATERNLTVRVVRSGGRTTRFKLAASAAPWSAEVRVELEFRIRTDGDVEVRAWMQGRPCPLRIPTAEASAATLEFLGFGRYRVILDEEHRLRRGVIRGLQALHAAGPCYFGAS